MHGYGWNPLLPPPTREQCVTCHQVFFSIEALINHYETHIREEELKDFLAMRQRINNNSHHLNHLQHPVFTGLTQPTTPQTFGRRMAALTTHAIIRQHQQQMALQPVPVLVQRRGHSLRHFDNGNMLISTPASSSASASASSSPQLMNQAVASNAAPDEIELDFRDEEVINGSNGSDGSINLDLTLSTP